MVPQSQIRKLSAMSLNMIVDPARSNSEVTIQDGLTAATPEL